MANNARKNVKATLNVGGRKTTSVSVDTYTNATDRGNTYGLQEGEKFRFPVFSPDLTIEQVEVRPGSSSYYYLIQGDIVRKDGNIDKDGSFFNLNSLMKRDAEGNYVNPTWAAIPAKDRVKALCDTGEVSVVRMETISVPVFDAEGHRQYETDENHVQHSVTRPQTVPILSNYAGA